VNFKPSLASRSMFGVRISFTAHAAEVGIAHVIDEDEDDVGAGIGGTPWKRSSMYDEGDKEQEGNWI